VSLAAHGLRVALPPGWSGRVFGRAGGAATLHAGDFAIPLRDTSSFGDRSAALMPAVATFIAIVEYVPGDGLEPGRGLFAARRIPRPLDPTTLAANGLARARPGQVGTQHFFTASNRPLCLYVVLAGGRATRRRQLLALDHVLGSLQIAQRV
jgi:hypothetical protein